MRRCYCTQIGKGKGKQNIFLISHRKISDGNFTFLLFLTLNPVFFFPYSDCLLHSVKYHFEKMSTARRKKMFIFNCFFCNPYSLFGVRFYCFLGSVKVSNLLNFRPSRENGSCRCARLLLIKPLKFLS